MRFKIVLFFLLSFVLCSCSPKVIEHFQYVRDTSYIERQKLDSIFVRDSIYIEKQNDTVYQYVEKWRTQYIRQTDTIFQSYRDTVVIKEIIEKELTALQRAKLDSYWALVIAIIALFIVLILKKII